MALSDTKALLTDDSEIREMREEYRDARTQKKDIRDEGDMDMAYLVNPWDASDQEEDRKQRKALNRPMIDADELNQYVNQLINDVRQNKRGAKVAPAGAGATDKTANLLQGLIRQIEYRSNAALDAYPVMFENCAQRSYGYLGIKPVYENPRSRHQELRIFGIPNPNMVTEDPYSVKADGSDWKFLYFAETWGRREFTRKFGAKAKFLSFDSEMMSRAPEWFSGDRILLAERWRVMTERRVLQFIDGPQGYHGPSLDAFEDEIDRSKLPPGSHVVGSREVDYPTVQMQIVNGVEVVEETDFKAGSLPFVPCYGKILFLDDGSGPKKQVMSLIRLARSPQMLYNYYRTQQAEMAGMMPKVPVIGYKGQFAGFENDWQKAPHEPLAYIEANFEVPGWPPSAGPMPLPQRLAYEAGGHLQALELCAEGARRAIQAAIGSSPLPTQAQRHNEKSGKALQQIEDTAQKGSFHFVDHFDAAVTRTGQILVEWIPFYYDAAREVTVRQADDQPTQVSINDPTNQDAVSAVDGMHDVTVSVGPRQISAREAASDFADTVLTSGLVQMLPPPVQPQIIALAFRLKDVGPIGDEMADLIAPKPDAEPNPQELQQLQGNVQQLQQQLQQAMEYIKTEQAKQQATIEKAHIDNAGKIAVARIGAAKSALDTAAEAMEERLSTGLTIAHEATQAEADRQHEAAMATMQATHGAMAADQAHGHALARGAAASDATMAQQAHQAALQPPPDAEGQ